MTFDPPRAPALDRRRLLGLGLAGLTGLTGLAGCSATATGTGGSTGPSAPAPGSDQTRTDARTLVVWADQARTPALTAVAAQFARDHAGATVQVVTKTMAEIAGQLAKAVADGSGPDLATVAHSQLGALRSAKAVAPLALGTSRGLLTPAAVSAFSVGAQIYGLPYGMAGLALVRNNKLSTARPGSWAELVAAGATARKPALAVGLGTANDPVQLFGWQSSFGNLGFTLATNGTLGGQVTLADQTGLDFAGWLAAQGSKGTKLLDPAVTPDLARQRFLESGAVFWLAGPGEVSALTEAKLDVAVLPIPTAGGRAVRPFLAVEGFVLSSASTNPLLATDLATNYLTGIDLQMAAAVGQVPVVRAALGDDAIADNPVLAGFADVGGAALPTPSAASMAKVWPLWGAAETQVIGGADPAATWTAAAGQVAGAYS